MQRERSIDAADVLAVGAGCDLWDRDVPACGLGQSVAIGHEGLGGAIGEARALGAAGMGSGAAEVLEPPQAAGWRFVEAEAAGADSVFLKGGSGLDTLGETVREEPFRRTGLAVAETPMAPAGPITIDELAVLGEASTILWQVQGRRTARRGTVEVASLGFATLRMLLENTVEP